MNIYETFISSTKKIFTIILFVSLISCSTDNADRLIATDSAFKENVDEPQVVAENTEVPDDGVSAADDPNLEDDEVFVEVPVAIPGGVAGGSQRPIEKGVIKGIFELNAEDHPDNDRGSQKESLNNGVIKIEVWDKNEIISLISGVTEDDGSFELTGITPGIWKLKYIDEWTGAAGFSNPLVVDPGETVTVYPGSIVSYDVADPSADQSVYSAVVSNIDKPSTTMTILDLSSQVGWEKARISMVDVNGIDLEVTVEDYARKLDVVVNDSAIKVKINYYMSGKNGESSPIFVFDASLVD